MKIDKDKIIVAVAILIIVLLIFHSYNPSNEKIYIKKPICDIDKHCDDANPYNVDECINPGTSLSYCKNSH